MTGHSIRDAAPSDRPRQWLPLWSAESAASGNRGQSDAYPNSVCARSGPMMPHRRARRICQ